MSAGMYPRKFWSTMAVGEERIIGADYIVKS
jgi:hypothetical protein